MIIAGLMLLFSGCTENREAARVSSEIRRSMNPTGVVKAFLRAMIEKDSYVLSQTVTRPNLYNDPVRSAQILALARKMHVAKWQEYFEAGGKARVMLTGQEQNGTVIEKNFYLTEVPRGKNSVYSWRIDSFR